MPLHGTRQQVKRKLRLGRPVFSNVLMLDIQDLHKVFGQVTALNGLTLHIPAGMIYGLLGPNGAGKTTILNIVMGLIRQSSGEVRLFDGQRPGQTAVLRRLGFMPQQLALYGGLSVLENVQFFGRLYGLRGADLNAQAEAMLEMVALIDQRDTLVRTLSGGMQRRAMLASALVHRPELLILDEPTAGVDPVLRLRFWNWFQEFVDDGLSILITTHHISEAARCQRVAFLRAGRLLEEGSPKALMEHHGTTDLEAAFVRATGENGEKGTPLGSPAGEHQP